jgi:hypothetical protein
MSRALTPRHTSALAYSGGDLERRHSVLLALLLSAPAHAAPAIASWLSGCLPTHSYKRTVSVTTGVAVTDYPVELTLNTAALIAAGKLRADCGDLRLLNSANAPLPHWLEGPCNSAATRVWVKLPSVPLSGATVVVAYGAPGATSASNGETTFLFFDDFRSDPNLGGRWQVSRAAGDAASEFSYDAANRQLFLTRAVGDRGGGGRFMVMDPAWEDHWRFRMRYQLSGRQFPADGLGMGFFHEGNGAVAGSHHMVLFGYNVEVDTYENFDDPAGMGRHLGVVATNPRSHLAAVPDARIGDGQAHELHVRYNQGQVIVGLDGDLSITTANLGTVTKTHRNMIVGAATGGDMDDHRISRVILQRYHPQGAVAGSPGAEAACFSLAFAIQPATTEVALALPPLAVEARRGDGSRASGFSATITVALGSNPGGGALSGSRTVNAIDGRATFSGLSIDRVGAGYTLSASSPSLGAVTSVLFDIVAGLPSRIAFLSSPGGQQTAGAPFQRIELEVLDARGNRTAAPGVLMSIALTGGAEGARLAGAQPREAEAGTVRFDGLTVDRAGSGYRLRASYGSELQPVESAPFEVVAGATSAILFEASPAGGVTFEPLAPIRIALRDAAGNPLPNTLLPVTISLASAPDRAELRGTVERDTVAGVADFTDLEVTVPGSYALRASTAGLTAESPTFTVVLPEERNYGLACGCSSPGGLGAALLALGFRALGWRRRAPAVTSRPACWRD